MNTKLPTWLPIGIVGIIAGAFTGWALASWTPLPLSESAGTGWGSLAGLLLSAGLLLLRGSGLPPTP